MKEEERCRATYRDQWGRAQCKLRRGHKGIHHWPKWRRPKEAK